MKRWVPAISMGPRVLDEGNAREVLDECMQELGTLFGSNAESRSVGITGLVRFVELDGPVLVISLSGRFWHQRSVVVERVSKYVMDRIPECVDVEIVDVAQLDDTDPTALQEKFAELDEAAGDGLSSYPVDLSEGVAAAQAVWEEHLDPDSGNPYYFNPMTGESVWEKPVTESKPRPQQAQPPLASFGNDGGLRPDQF